MGCGCSPQITQIRLVGGILRLLKLKAFFESHQNGNPRTQETGHKKTTVTMQSLPSCSPG
jgi:hypothetical protein